MGSCLLGGFSFIYRRCDIQRYSSLAHIAAVRLKSSLQSNSFLLSLVLSRSPLDRTLDQYTLYQREVTCFVDEAILGFRQTRLTRENVKLNIGYLRDKVRIGRVGEYFKLARNCLRGKIRIGRVGEYFKLARNCLRSKVRIKRIGEYFKPTRNR